MKTIKQYAEIITQTDYDTALSIITTAGRTCYKSERKGTREHDERFIRNLIKSGHDSVLEHFNITYRLVTSRTVTHQLVRHRIGHSYSQASQRYCNYSNDKFGNEVSFISPDFSDCEEQSLVWANAMESAEQSYFEMLEGTKPEIARSVLPNSTATEIIVTSNIRALRNLLKLRLQPDVQPEFRELMLELLRLVHIQYPVFVEDLWEEYNV